MKTHYLYEKFRDWEDEYDRIFIYSDCHGTGNGLDKDAVNTHNLFSYASDEEQIENINKIATRRDLIIFLGDMGDYSKFKKELKCKNWVLIKGNHDKGTTTYTNDFIEVYDGPLFISSKILLSHAPLRDDNNRWLNIHGHLHNQSEIDNNCFHDNYICVSANLIGYRPICLSDLLKRKNEFKDYKGLSNVVPINRYTTDKAIVRKQERLANEQQSK